jgi:hypothetical protein
MRAISLRHRRRVILVSAKSVRWIHGPIPKRTFFFADYEGTRLREGLTRINNVPTIAERNGNFSQSVLPKPVIPGSNFPFPGNQIPDIFIDPIGKRIAALYPLPNRNVPLQNFVSSPARKDRDDLFDARVDHSLLNDRSRLLPGTASLIATSSSLFPAQPSRLFQALGRGSQDAPRTLC